MTKKLQRRKQKKSKNKKKKHKYKEKRITKNNNKNYFWNKPLLITNCFINLIINQKKI